MSASVSLRGVTFGAGRPKICIPVAAESWEDILSAGRRIAASPGELAEWRLDLFSAGAVDPARTAELAGELRQILGDKPLLITLRTVDEGGSARLSPDSYAEVLTALAQSRIPDALDVELSAGQEHCERIITSAHRNGVRVILSSHDFEKTPDQTVLEHKYRSMEALGGDLAKFAVMPQKPEDVIRLLQFTSHTAAAGSLPLITMSMSDMGVISRVAGEVYGSVMTFGALGRGSAPGQVQADRLAQMLESVHRRPGAFPPAEALSPENILNFERFLT